MLLLLPLQMTSHSFFARSFVFFSSFISDSSIIRCFFFSFIEHLILLLLYSDVFLLLRLFYIFLQFFDIHCNLLHHIGMHFRSQNQQFTLEFIEQNYNVCLLVCSLVISFHVFHLDFRDVILSMPIWNEFRISIYF